MQLRGRLRVSGTTISSLDVAEAWRRALPAMLRAIRTRAFANLSGRLVGVRKGELRGSLREVIEPRGGGLPAGRVGAEDFKGAIFEGGAAPHEIRASRGRHLRFQIRGRWITPTRVQHPGIRPRRWLATAVDESQPDLDRILRQEFELALERRLRGGRIPVGRSA